MTYFDNKVIWVTGASSGIGEEIVKQLDKESIKIVISSRNAEKLNAIKAILKLAECLVLPLDLSNQKGFDQHTQKVIEAFGRIDILINNGGISQRANVSETSMEVERQIMETNYFGNIALSKVVLKQMKVQGSGHLVIMSSISGKFGFFMRSAYSASKHALHGYYESLRLEEEMNGIDVTLVCPGKINTDISLNALLADGTKHNKIDKNQSEGMPVTDCVKKILRGIAKKKFEIFVGGKEVNAVLVKRFFPKLIHRILRKQKATE